MGLNLISNDKEKGIVREWGIGTNFGRVYINSQIKDYERIAPDKLRIENRVITLPKQTQYGNITYTHSLLRAYNVGELSEYFKITDSFMERLIRENIKCSFENIPFLKDIKLSDTDKHSLLKPVYYRYKTKDHSALKAIQDNLNKINKDSCTINYGTMTLFDVPCIIKDSKLRILDNFWIDISESTNILENGRYIPYVFNCISLGVKKFSKVEIVFENVTNMYSNNILYGKQIKEIILIKD